MIDGYTVLYKTIISLAFVVMADTVADSMLRTSSAKTYTTRARDIIVNYNRWAHETLRH